MRLRTVTCSLVGALAFTSTSLVGCGEDAAEPSARAQVEVALAAFAADLAAQPIVENELSARIRTYLEAHPTFYGSTVTLIGDDGLAYYSPYVYRQGSGFAERDLAYPAYDIDHQDWLVQPRDTKQPVWSPVYFDAGGGEIWMVTRSVPLLRNGTVYAVATTDLPVPPPAD